MLLYPSVDLLRKKVDSKYTLAVMSAKRARDLIDGKPTLVPAEDTIKPISIATEEISEDLISYKRGADAVDYPIETESDAGFSFSADTIEDEDEENPEDAEYKDDAEDEESEDENEDESYSDDDDEPGVDA
jgi:DNA-directed RNA polymerase subunit omega